MESIAIYKIIFRKHLCRTATIYSSVMCSVYYSHTICDNSTSNCTKINVITAFYGFIQIYLYKNTMRYVCVCVHMCMWGMDDVYLCMKWNIFTLEFCMRIDLVKNGYKRNNEKPFHIN